MLKQAWAAQAQEALTVSSFWAGCGVTVTN
jgi:hypothetical protein